MLTDYSLAVQPSFYWNALAVVLITFVLAYSPRMGKSHTALTNSSSSSLTNPPRRIRSSISSNSNNTKTGASAGGSDAPAGSAETQVTIDADEHQQHNTPAAATAASSCVLNPAIIEQQQQRRALALFAVLVAGEAVQLPYQYRMYASIGHSGAFKRMRDTGISDIIETVEDAALYVTYLMALGVALAVVRRIVHVQKNFIRASNANSAAKATATTIDFFKKLCFYSAVLGAIGCSLRFSSSFGTQLVARGVLGGASSGLLIVGFEGWLVAISGGAPQRHELLSSIHASMLHVACLVAVPSCLISQVLATTCNTPFAPFVCAAVLYSIGAVCLGLGVPSPANPLIKALFGSGWCDVGTVAVSSASSSPGGDGALPVMVDAFGEEPAASSNNNRVALGGRRPLDITSIVITTLKQVSMEASLLMVALLWTPHVDPPIEERLVGMAHVPHGAVCACLVMGLFLGRFIGGFILSSSGGGGGAAAAGTRQKKTDDGDGAVGDVCADNPTVATARRLVTMAFITSTLALAYSWSHYRDIRCAAFVVFMVSFGVYHYAAGVIHEEEERREAQHDGGDTEMTASLPRSKTILGGRLTVSTLFTSGFFGRMLGLFAAALSISLFFFITHISIHNEMVGKVKIGALIFLPIASGLGLLVCVYEFLRVKTQQVRRGIRGKWGK